MKVLHLISGGDSGGAKTHMFTLLDEQCKIADVTVGCLMAGVFWKELQLRDVKSVMFEQKHRFDISVCRDIVRFVKENGIDIINAHGARANFVAALIKKKVGVPIVTTVHSDYLLDFDTPIKKILFGGLNRISLRRIDFRIGVSDSFRDMLIERNFRPNTTYSVYNGINFDEALPELMSREVFAASHGIPLVDGAVYIGIAARFDRVKGVDVFIDAAAKVISEEKNVHFVIAGNGPLENELKEQAASLGIADKVHFIGFVSPIWSFLSFVDVNCLTSRCESFPYALLEGAKMKKPTLASAVGGIPTLIINGRTGMLFKSEDSQDCADAMLRLVRDSEFRTRLADSLYEKAKKEFSNKALAEKYISNYKSIIIQSKRKKKYDIILSGYYGYDNYGDELILQTLIAAYKKADPDIQLAVFSHSPKKTRLECRTDSYGRFNIHAIHSAMRNCRMYVNGGGTLLTDVTSRRSLRYYTTMLSLAKKHKLKTMLLANGIGPFNSESSKAIAVKALKNIDLITLRDKGTLDSLSEELSGVKTVLTADIAFISGFVVPEKTKSSDSDYFLVSVREWVNNAPGFETVIARCCDRICEKYSLRALILPMQPQKDTEISEKIVSLMKNSAQIAEYGESITERASQIAGARFVIAMRLHPLICAVINSVPVVALTYDDKVTNFMQEQNAGAVIGADTVSEDVLFAETDKVAGGNSVHTEKYEKDIENLRSLSWKNIELSLELLEEAEGK